MNSEVMAVPIFTGILVLFAVVLGLTIGRRRRRKIAESIAADQTELQATQILQELFPDGSVCKAVPAIMELTSGQLAAQYGKDFAASAALSLVTGKKVHTYRDDSGDDNYMLAYSSTDLYLISIIKDYKNISISADRNYSPLHLSTENVEKFKYNSVSGKATIVLKDKQGKFAITPTLQFFDKPYPDRKKECMLFLKEFAQRF